MKEIYQDDVPVYKEKEIDEAEQKRFDEMMNKEMEMITKAMNGNKREIEEDNIEEQAPPISDFNKSKKLRKTDQERIFKLKDEIDNNTLDIEEDDSEQSNKPKSFESTFLNSFNKSRILSLIFSKKLEKAKK
jgi:hypothetical protein